MRPCARIRHYSHAFRAVVVTLNNDRSTENRASDAGMDAELIVSINVSLDFNSSDHRTDNEVEAKLQPICNVTIELSSYAVLSDVQVCVDVCKPLVVADDFYALPNLCKQTRRHSCPDVLRQPNSQLSGERHATKTRVYVDGDLPAISSEIRATVTYRTDAGALRSVRRTSQLPLKTMLRSCPPESSASFVTVIKSGAPLLTFTQLFPGKRVFNSVPSIDGPNLWLSFHHFLFFLGSSENRKRPIYRS